MLHLAIMPLAERLLNPTLGTTPPLRSQIPRLLTTEFLQSQNVMMKSPSAFSWKFIATCIAIVSLATLGSSQKAIDRNHYQDLTKQLSERARQKDWQGARNVLAEIGKELPVFTPRYLLTVASVEAHLGHKEEALKWLQRYAAMGLSYDLGSDNDLKPFLAETAGQNVVAQMKENSKPVVHAELVCSLPQADTMPEDITYLPSLHSFVVSSIRHHTLYRISLPKGHAKDCSMQELPLSHEAKRWPTMAVSFDARRNALWVTASAMPGFKGFPKEDEGKAVLMEVDPASGKVLHRFVPDTKGPAVLGDMSVAADGTVYVTDSIGGGVYRLRGDIQTARLEQIADGLFSPQTPTVAGDGKRLFIADYTMGVAVIDLPPPGGQAKPVYLPHPESIATVGLDGLYLDSDSLIGIQNGTEPMRVLRLRLNRSQAEITSAEVIEQTSDPMGDPTHATLANGWFYVSANVGWSKVDDDTGELKQGAPFTPPVLLRFRARSAKPN